MTASLLICLTLLAIAATLVGSQPCLNGIRCVAKQYPHAQALYNPGKNCGPDDGWPGRFANLYDNQGMYGPLLYASREPTLTLETPLQIRMFLLYMLAVWNSITPFHPTATATKYAPGFGLPFDKWTVTNETQAIAWRNTALSYAYQRVLEAVLPAAAETTAPVMTKVGLDPNYRGYSNPHNSAADVGNAAAYAVLAYWLPIDGWNEFGTQAFNGKYANILNPPPFGSGFYPNNFTDWTKFMPVNTAYHLKNITQWQPLLEHNGRGYFTTQTHITAQAGWTKPCWLTPEQVENMTAPAPWPDVMDDKAMEEYKKEADLVIKSQAPEYLTERWKLTAEHFDVKPIAFGATLFGIYSYKYNWDLTHALAYDLALPMFHDATLVAWRNKIKYSSVRPISAIRYLYGDTNISEAYRGPGLGSGPLPGSMWSSYLRTMPHADYPSATACLCGAFAEYNERFIGSTEFDYQYELDAGCSTREPGITPRERLTLSFKTKREWLDACAYSRLYAGVHFKKSIDAALKLCAPIGEVGYREVRKLLGMDTVKPAVNSLG